MSPGDRVKARAPDGAIAGSTRVRWTRRRRVCGRHEDELVHVLEGHPALVIDAGEVILTVPTGAVLAQQLGLVAA